MGIPEVRTGCARVVAPGVEWDCVLALFAHLRVDDIYFDHRYVNLYVKDSARAEAFVFEDGDRLFFFPYILRPIDCREIGSCWDFESAYGYGGPLSNTEDRDFLIAAWSAFSRYGREKRIVAGFIRFHPLIENHRFVPDGAFSVVADRKTVALTLDQTESQVWSGYSEDNRNKLRRAMRQGVAVEAYENAESVQSFAKIYRQHMMEINAAQEYHFGADYFERIGHLGRGRFRVYMAVAQSEIIGSALVLFSDHYAHYHLSSSLRQYFTFAPNNILRHAVIMSLLGGPYVRLHFGGGRSGDPKDSLLRFKKKFSHEECQYYIGKYVADLDLYDRLCADWEKRHPEMVGAYGTEVLRYRRQGF